MFSDYEIMKMEEEKRKDLLGYAKKKRGPSNAKGKAPSLFRFLAFMGLLKLEGDNVGK